LVNGHFRKDLTPGGAHLSWSAFSAAIANHVRLKPLNGSDAWSYNLLQRLTYLSVIFILFPLIIWTGLGMSPAVMSAFPGMVSVLGGQQSARTIHFFVSGFLLLFVVVHIIMICVAGFKSRMRAMITGRPDTNKEDA
jgi:thiosulfate reductase cytochrome b subunit